MSFISTPLTYIEPSLRLNRDIKDRITMLDNLVELIVFTPRGSFAGDPDFGFEYWNHEFSNVHSHEFNINQGGSAINDTNRAEFTKKECEDSVRESLATYEPMLKNVTVNIILETAVDKSTLRKKMPSKYELNVLVEGTLDDGLGTRRPYQKVVNFYIEPTVKRYRG